MSRRRSLVPAFALLLLLALASYARAQITSSVLLFPAPGGTLVSEISVQLRVEGQIVVSFHGDAGTGCATYGLCPYSGTIIVRARSGVAEIATYRRHGRTERQASVLLVAAPSQDSTAARVERSIPGQAPGLCADAEANSLNQLSTATHAGAVTIRLFTAGGTALSTRCAGPLDADVAGVGPAVTIPLNRLARGDMTVNLVGGGGFASHGFAGTVSSTLALILGRPSKQTVNGVFPRGIKATRTRTVTERLTLTRITGDLGAGIQGVANPIVCQQLDSCGLLGTLGFGHAASRFTGELVANGPASRPYGDFLAALGLSAGNPRGISVGLSGAWAMGPTTATVAQSGQACTDSTSGEQMFFDGAATRGELRAAAGATSIRTRCPGPSLADGDTLLEGALPLGSLARRAFTIALRAGGVVEDDGYTMTVHGRLALVLRRGRISQQVSVTPAG